MKNKWLFWIIRIGLILLATKFLMNKDIRHWVFGPGTGDIVLDEHGFPTRYMPQNKPVNHQVVIDNSGKWVPVETYTDRGMNFSISILTSNVYWQAKSEKTGVVDLYPMGQDTEAQFPSGRVLYLRVNFGRHPYDPNNPVKAILYVEYEEAKQQ